MRDKIARFGHTTSSYRPTPASTTSGGVNRGGGRSSEERGGGGSVRDKIAQFGDKNAGVAVNIVHSSAPSSRFQPPKTSSTCVSHPAAGGNSGSPSVSASAGNNVGLESSTGPVRKLKVPDVFQNAKKPPDGPVLARVSSAPTLAPAKKWGTVGGSTAGDASGSKPKPSVGAVVGGSNSFSANARGS